MLRGFLISLRAKNLKIVIFTQLSLQSIYSARCQRQVPGFAGMRDIFVATYRAISVATSNTEYLKLFFYTKIIFCWMNYISGKWFFFWCKYIPSGALIGCQIKFCIMDVKVRVDRINSSWDIIEKVLKDKFSSPVMSLTQWLE